MYRGLMDVDKGDRHEDYEVEDLQPKQPSWWPYALGC